MHSRDPSPCSLLNLYPSSSISPLLLQVTRPLPTTWSTLTKLVLPAGPWAPAYHVVHTHQICPACRSLGPCPPRDPRSPNLSCLQVPGPLPSTWSTLTKLVLPAGRWAPAHHMVHAHQTCPPLPRQQPADGQPATWLQHYASPHRCWHQLQPTLRLSADAVEHLYLTERPRPLIQPAVRPPANAMEVGHSKPCQPTFSGPLPMQWR